MAAKKKPTGANSSDKQNWLGQVVTRSEIENDTEPVQSEPETISETREASSQEPEIKFPRSKKYYAAITDAFLIVMVLLWAVSSFYLSRFSVGSLSVPANASDSHLIKDINQQVAAYKLVIGYPDGTEKKYPLANLGLSVDTRSTLNDMRAQQRHLINRLVWWRPLKSGLVLNINTAMFSNFISTAMEITVQPSKDASLSIAGGNISIADGVTGKQYGLTNATPTLLFAAKSLGSSPIKLQTLAVNPALTAGELAPYKTTLTKTLNQASSFLIGGQTITPSASDIASWLEITPNDKTKKVTITVNSGKVLAYIDHIAASLIRPAKAQVNVVASDGSTQVLVPGINGVNVTNKNAIATDVANNLLSGNGFSEALPVNYQAYETITAGNYPKWIEVDLTNKRLYAYQNTTLMMTDLVTAGAPKTPTVTGQYAIYSKYATQNMRGENVDGSSYFQPNVPWINYFYKDYAIHGNYWRPTSYFGNVNSSHGCVGLWDADASWVYNWAPIGTPVIVHT